MRQQERIIEEKEIGRWPGQPCHIKPLFCTPDELQQDVHAIHRKFYSLPSIFRRLPMPLNTSTIASWVLNFSQRRVASHANEELNFTNY
jgi:hypothetical protein